MEVDTDTGTSQAAEPQAESPPQAPRQRRRRSPQSVEGFPVRIRVLEGRPNADQQRLTIYSGEVPAVIAARFNVRRVGEEGGFQRELDTTRVRALARLMAGPNRRAYIYGGVTVALRDGGYRLEKLDGATILTLLEPPDVVEGQHRLAADAFVDQHGGVAVADWTESVRFIAGAHDAELALWYCLINTQMRKPRPDNILANIALMEGVQMGRKSWVARVVGSIAASEPFRHETPEGEIVRLVAVSKSSGGRIQPQSLYDSLDAMLPAELNREGEEARAVEWARKAFELYAGLTAAAHWGEIDGDGRVVPLRAYEYISLVAFAYLIRTATAKHPRREEMAFEEVRRAYDKAGLTDTDLDAFGSGARGALAMANNIAGAGRMGAVLTPGQGKRGRPRKIPLPETASQAM